MNNSILLLINGWAAKSQLLDTIMIFCAKYLVYIVFVVVAMFVVYWLYKRQWRTVAYVFLSLVVTFIFLKLAGLLNLDHRPFMDHHLTQLVAHASGKSFPSDHTTVTAGIAFAFLFFTRFKKTGVLILLAACVIGFARVFVGIHYPLDILGGLVVGLIGAVIAYGITKFIPSKKVQFTTPSDQTE